MAKGSHCERASGCKNFLLVATSETGGPKSEFCTICGADSQAKNTFPAQQHRRVDVIGVREAWESIWSFSLKSPFSELHWEFKASRMG